VCEYEGRKKEEKIKNSIFIIKNMKLKTVIKDVILESKDSYNTPAAISKQEELTKKNAKTKADDSITDLDLNTMNRNNTVKKYSYGPLNPDDKKGSKKFWEKTIVKNANIGFCEFFWFKCAGARSCDAWVGGGPIK
jgi:hypothetical protein